MTGLGFVAKLLPGSRRRKGTAVRKPTRSRPELAAAGGRGDPPALRHRFSRALRLTLASPQRVGVD